MMVNLKKSLVFLVLLILSVKCQEEDYGENKEEDEDVPFDVPGEMEDIYIGIPVTNAFGYLLTRRIFLEYYSKVGPGRPLKNDKYNVLTQEPMMVSGGLFESLDEIGAKAFELAVNYVNERELLPGKRLVANISEVQETDSFEVGKKVCGMLRSGRLAGVFGPRSPVTSEHVQSISDNLELPHIISRANLNQRRSSCLINLYPHHTALSAAIREVVEAWLWKGFTIIYDSYDALRKMNSLLQLADDKGYLVTVRQLEDEEGNYRKMLKEIKHSEEKNIVLECSIDILYEVLIQAQQVGLMGSGYNYIITTLDFHTIDLSPFMWAGTNITSLRLVNPEDPYVQEIASIWEENMGEEEEGEGNPEEGEEGAENELPENRRNEEENGGRKRKRNTSNESKRFSRSPSRGHRKSERRERQTVAEGEKGGGEEEEYGEEGNGDEGNGNGDEDVPEETLPTSEIPPTEAPVTQELPIPTVEAALIHDSVLLFAKALEHLENIALKEVDCESDSGLDFGFSIINFMKLSEVQGMTGLIKFDHEGFRTDVKLDIIELTEEGLVYKGHWNKSLHIVYPPGEEPPQDPGEDLRNTTFIVLIALTPPYNMLKDSSKALNGNDRYEGFGVDLIQELAAMNGFNYTFKEQKDKSSGNPTTLPNGTRVWNGMIGEVQAGRADLAIADITITRERERDADFTHPFMNLGIQILHRKPKKAPPELFSFLSPFSPEVWAYMMSAYIGVSILFFIMARISPAEWTNPYPCIEEPENLECQFSLINSFWFTVGSLMQQGSDVAPIAISTRMAASIWWFFTLIMVSSYTANLAAFLTIENPEIPFKDIASLVKVKDMTWGAKKGGSTVNFFRDSTDPDYQKVYEFMKNNPDCMMDTNEAGVQRVQTTKNYAFFMESTSIEYEIERKCDLTAVGGYLDSKGYGIVMRQNSSYRNVLSKNVVQLQEKGKLTQLYNKWWKEKRGGGACGDSSETSEASELNLANVGGVYVVLLGGCVFSVFITAFELLWDIYQREDKESFKEELKKELKFIIKCRGTVKPLKKAEGSQRSNSSSSGRSKNSKHSRSSKNHQ